MSKCIDEKRAESYKFQTEKKSENEDQDALLRLLKIWHKNEQKWLVCYHFCHSGYKLVVIVGSHVKEIMFSGL